MIDMNVVLAFLEVAKAGNISTAAATLHITPSAVSQKIKALEVSLGKCLFVRKRQGVELSQHGIELFKTCQNLQKDVKRINDLFGSRTTKLSGDITITTPAGLLSYELPDFVKGFLEKYPDIFITVRSVSSSATVEDEVQNARCDLGIIVGKCKKMALRSVLLTPNDKILMICSSEHALAKKKSIRKSDLLNTRLIWHGSYQNRSFHDVSRQIGIKLYKIKHKLCLPDMESCKKHVLTGTGISFISEMYIRDELKSGKIVALPGFKMNKQVFLISRNEKYESSAISTFKKALIDYCSKITSHVSD